MSKINNEVKTGMMVVVCLVALGILTFKVGDFKVLKKGYEIKVVFSYTTGIEKNAPVRICGVESGEVRSIELTNDDKGNAKAILTVWLPEKIKVRNDSSIQINMLGLMGEKYVEIFPSNSTAPYMNNGDSIAGQDPFRAEEFVAMGKELGRKFDELLTDLETITEEVNGVLKGNRKDIDQIVLNLRDTTSNFKEFSEDLKKHPWKLLFKTKEKDDKKNK